MRVYFRTCVAGETNAVLDPFSVIDGVVSVPETIAMATQPVSTTADVDLSAADVRTRISSSTSSLDEMFSGDSRVPEGNLLELYCRHDLTADPFGAPTSPLGLSELISVMSPSDTPNAPGIRHAQPFPKNDAICKCSLSVKHSAD